MGVPMPFKPNYRFARFERERLKKAKEPYNNYDCNWLRDGWTNFMVLGAIE